MTSAFTGHIIPDADCCINCRGKKVCVEKKGLDFWIEKGMKNDQKIILRGKGDQAPNMEPGNIVVILQEEPHEAFKRRDDDLYFEKEISLTEALCGFSFALTHLDGRVLRIMQPPGACVESG
jgi:DnaJ family protein A protein 2